MWKKIGLAVLALLALAIAYVRPVYSVSLDGMELAGLWDGRTVDVTRSYYYIFKEAFGI